MRSWAEDLKESKRLFIEVVYPEIQGWFNDAELIPVEGIEDVEMATELDRLSGIDFWNIEADSGMYGLASRVQPRTDAWGTFTIRRSRDSGAKTEFSKRLEQIENGYLHPEYTIQAYTRYGELENAAAVRTQQLIRYIDEGIEGTHWWIRETHNADFYCVHWADLQSQAEVDIYDSDYGFLADPVLADVLPKAQTNLGAWAQ